MVDLTFFLNPDEKSGDIRVNQGSFLSGTTNSHASGLDAASIDFGLPAGTDIYPFADGRVVGAHSGYTDALYPTMPVTGAVTFGNYVTIEYNFDGMPSPVYVTYAHLSRVSADYWVDQLTAAGGPVDISNTAVIGEVADSPDTPYPVHLHMGFATSYGNYGFPNGIAESFDNAANANLLMQLSIGSKLLSTLAENDYVPSSPVVSDMFPSDGVSETISFADAITELGASSGSDVARLYLSSVFGPVVSNVRYTGSDNAAFLVSNFDIVGSGISLDGGVLLSSGGYPNSSNTSSSSSFAHGTPGDVDLNSVATAAFSGAGTTFDAASFEFDIFVSDPDVDGFRIDLVFGSDEYPEFSNTALIDVAAVFVNGENKALLNGDADTPLSVIDQNLALNFLDNTAGTYGIEWDGFGAFTLRPALKQGLNHIKIAVADTGDRIYDSAIYVTNFELLRDGAVGQGPLKVVNGSVEQNDLGGTEAKEEFNLADAVGSVFGTLKELTGDVITGFTNQSKIILENITLLKDQVKITFGSAILNIDEDNDGDSDGVITLEGDFENAEFNISAIGTSTEITVAFASDNSAPVAFDDTFYVSEDNTLAGDVLHDSGQGTDADPDGDALTVSLLSGPAEGVITLNADGSFFYDADADAFDLATPGDVVEQSFTYQIADASGALDQATATIFVTILNDGVTLNGGNGRQTLTGSDGGEDLIRGGKAQDVLYGLDGADSLDGGLGDDRLFGGDGPDALRGDSGDDRLSGDRGNNSLDGGKGNDILIGGFGNDTLRGNSGSDVFVFGEGEGTDTVVDFRVGVDRVGLVGLTYQDLTITQAGHNSAISADGEVLALLVGIEPLALDASNFFAFTG